jgi:hypothetical protein
VVKDASSGDSRELLSSDGANERAPQLPAENLSELAQLLAASIARNQNQMLAGRGKPATTNAELTSLAGLVSAASSQRALASASRDGLSSLSYSQPRPGRIELPMPDPGELPPDDEPMPIPSTWREPTRQDEESWFRQQMGAALLGLVAGLIIVVPSVLWLSGWLDQPKARATLASHSLPPAPEAKSPEVRTVKVQVRALEKPETATQFVTGSLEPTRLVPEPRAMPEAPTVETTAARMIETTVEDSKVADARVAEAKVAEARIADEKAIEARAAELRLAEARARLDEVLAQATRRIENGDVTGAREVLAGADDGAQGPVAFVLAETYDPNMLAAWGSRGVAADVARAKALYRKALANGVASAQHRLEALK